MEKHNPKRFPDFFKIYLSEFSSERMLIPHSFVRHVKGLIPKKTILRSSLGKQWPVRVVKTDQGTYFTDGWRFFLQENAIQEGEFLVFRFRDGMFNVVVLGHSLCQKNNPSRMKGKEVAVIKEEQEQDDDDDDGDDDDDDCNDVDDEHGGGGEEEQQEQDDDDDDDDDDDGDDDKDYNDVDDEHEGGEEEHQEDQHLQLRNPSFRAKPQSGHRCKLHVPSKVIEDNNLKFNTDIIFQDPSDRKWRGKVATWKDGRTWIGGWDIICRKNILKEDQEFVCELMLDNYQGHRCGGYDCYHICDKIKVHVVNKRKD